MKRLGTGVRRRMIRRLIRTGLSNKEIAAHLGINLRGVKWHVSQIRREVGVYGHADERRLMIALLKGNHRNHSLE